MPDKLDATVGSIRAPLRDILTGAVVSFLGIIIMRLAGLSEKVLIARFFDPSRYGQVILAISLLSMVTVVGSLGLRTGVVRYLSRHDNNSDQLRVVTASVRLTGVASAVFAVLLFLFSDVLAMRIFNDPQMAPLLKIVAVGVPLAVLGQLGASIARGMKDARSKNLIENISFPVSRVLFIGGAIVLGFGTIGIGWAYVGGYAFMTLLGASYVYLVFGIPNAPDVEYRNLLRFSVPLLFANSMSFINSSLDTILIGAFLTSDQVGIYGAAYPLGRLVFIAPTIMGVIFTPVISDLQASDKVQEIPKIYAIVARWIVILTLPGLILLVIEPEIFLRFIFGTEYSTGSTALVILALGFFFHVGLGINGGTLKMLGQSDFFLLSTVVNAVINVGLNIWLIPRIGIVGAAVATAVSYAIGNSLVSIQLYRDYRITPLTIDNLLTYFIYLPIIGISYTALSSVFGGFGLILSVYLLALLVFLIAYFVSGIPSVEERQIIDEYRSQLFDDY
ncbi:flippase [Haloarcula amylolytica]|uniref:Polysaccharide biosynthesis protein n=1 Tax=Haloarcula amylolytica JCM 13557 TaxID=1227452 RepID=M0KDU9_9EURY|nr:flippase [Haloarcula amylolytica]EMA18379.1 polysaccharide biosynthesis protein [Haloarcula amylolytica JCM 13557]